MNNTKNNKKTVLKIEDIQDFTLNRFEDIKKTNNTSELIHFHTINKYLLMSQDPNQLRVLGNIVANHENQSNHEIFAKYDESLRKIMVLRPTLKSHLNTLYHIFGHFSKNLNRDEKESFLNSIQDFKMEKKTLNEILVQLKQWTDQYDKKYLVRQTYFLLYTNKESI